MEQTFNWKRLLITTGFVILTAGVVGGTTWYLMDEQAKKDIDGYDSKIVEIEKELGDLKKVSEDRATESDTSNPGVIDEDDSQASTYSNSKYGFTIKYPETYKAEERYQSEDIDLSVLFIPSALNNPSMGVGIPMNSITVYPKKGSTLELWAKAEFSELQPRNFKTVTINKVSGLYFINDGMGGPYHTYVFEKNSRAYVISSPEDGAINHTQFVNGFSFNQ